MYWRSCIRAGDGSTAGGVVQPRPQQYPRTEYGALAAYEGDPVWCPACNSHGIAKCVQPFRPDTDPGGRQRILDGDLCICKCPEPPRLLARFDNVRVEFNAEEIRRSLPHSAGWVHYKNLGDQFRQSAEALNCGKMFRFVDRDTGALLANRGFVVNDGGVLREGRTNTEGIAVIQQKSGQDVTIHMVFKSPVGEMKFEG